MFGSDWPVAVLRGGYAKVWRETRAALANLGPAEHDRILGGIAVEVYRLSVGDVVSGDERIHDQAQIRTSGSP